MKRYFLLVLFLSVLFLSSRQGFATSYDTLSFDYPLDGGGVVMLTKTWALKKYLHTGFFVGGGQINRDFELESSNGGAKFQAHTKTTLAPFFGPQVTLLFKFIGLSLGYGVYHAKSDFDVDVPSVGKLTGQRKGWGTAFYSPLLVLDFYDSKHNVIFGFGLGGFLDGSNKKLKASRNSTTLETDESPIDTLSFHFHLTWAGKPGKSEVKPKDDWDF